MANRGVAVAEARVGEAVSICGGQVKGELGETGGGERGKANMVTQVLDI